MGMQVGMSESYARCQSESKLPSLEDALLRSRMTYAGVIQVACRIAVSGLLAFTFFLWCLVPFMLHDSDRTLRFWIEWGLVVAVLLAVGIGLLVLVLRRK